MNQKIWGIINVIVMSIGCVVIPFHTIIGLIINCVGGISTLCWILYPFFKRAITKDPS